MIILCGHVDVFQQQAGHRSLIVTHGPGGFMGELAQLGGRPALVDAIAQDPVQADRHPHRAVARSPRRRGGARRAHHACAHPAAHGADRVGRRRAGDRRQRRRMAMCCGSKASCAAMAIRYHAPRPRDRLLRQGADRAVPGRAGRIADRRLCPNGQMLRNPTETELARCIGLVSAARPGPPLRCRHRRRWSRRPGDGRLRRFRGSFGRRPRLPRVRRPGRRLGAHRELSRAFRPASPAWP